MRVQWGYVRRTFFAMRASFRGGEWRACDPIKTPPKPPPNWTSTMQLNTSAITGNCRPLELNSKFPKWSRQGLSTSMDAKASAAIKRMPVKVGAQLKIDVVGTNADVDVTVGDSLEEIVLEARWKAGHGVGDWSSFIITESPSNVMLKTVADFPNPGSSALEGLRAAMPARWCSLVVEAGQNPVRIQSLKEGSLTVKTFGGNITLGDLRGGTASIESNGGHFTAEVVSADSVIQTRGGNLSVKRLVGTTIDVDTGGGDVLIGSLYGNDVVIESRGGSVEAKHIQAQDTAVVSTDGGAVKITGMDGNARIVTRGGSVEVQLHEHAREVEIDASNGTVTLYFSDHLSAQMEYHGATDIEQESSILMPTGEPGLYSFVGPECWGRVQPEESRATRSEEASQAGSEKPQLCRIHIVSSGRVRVAKRGWIDVAMASSLPSFVR